jgi:hypothetical protein
MIMAVMVTMWMMTTMATTMMRSSRWTSPSLSLLFPFWWLDAKEGEVVIFIICCFYSELGVMNLIGYLVGRCGHVF